jgi:hypothetical protein
MDLKNLRMKYERCGVLYLYDEKPAIVKWDHVLYQGILYQKEHTVASFCIGNESPILMVHFQFAVFPSCSQWSHIIHQVLCTMILLEKCEWNFLSKI